MIKLPTLYHGTDARIVRMTEAERLQYLNGCNQVIDYLFQFYKPLLENVKVEEQINGMTCYVFKPKIEVQYKKLFIENDMKALFYLLHEKISMIDWSKNGAQLYQYGSFYVTKNKERAQDFAYKAYAGGELAMNAYYLIKGIEFIQFPDYNPSKEVKNAITTILDFSKKGKEEPVVFALDDLNREHLFEEDGKEVDWSLGFITSNLRYTGEIKLDLSKAEFLPRRG